MEVSLEKKKIKKTTLIEIYEPASFSSPYPLRYLSDCDTDYGKGMDIR